ncbi:MAG: type III-A CRISPR-associated protein Cas10/Csm1 [Xanthomonadales bacterium]|nr:type III-A CRISPR-associated protein Cas10/Csm1 [Xanthomonadales bacterium]
MTNQRLAGSCRVALAAFLHDLGKLAERARIPEAQVKDADGNTCQAINELLACPEFKGRRTHIHAAYTAIALDLLEVDLPNLVGEDVFPFSAWGERNADDSLLNAAARHHRPDSFLQWIIASADRLASGFERSTFSDYNAAPDEEQSRLNHYTTRQWTLFEGIRLQSDKAGNPRRRYPLTPISAKGIFPVTVESCEHGERQRAQSEYLQLWEGLKSGLKAIPESHRVSLPLWLDHFDSLWLTYTHAIPSATAGIGGQVTPDVSLYDHSKTTAALAVALWRYHADQQHDQATVREELRLQWDLHRAQTSGAEDIWNEKKFLLIQGDFFGIQNFIFGEGSQTQKRAARLLRGRSFYVSLLTELAALKVLEGLDLPATSQVLNAAGKFLILAPNTPDVVERLQMLQRELDDWFVDKTYGQSGVGLAWLPASSSDFKKGDAASSPFGELMKRLFSSLETAKMQRLGLCDSAPTPAVFTGFLDNFSHGECRVDGRSPATKELEGGVWVSSLAFDQIKIGEWLAKNDRLLVTRAAIQPRDGQVLNQPALDIFGFHLLFTDGEDRSGMFGTEARRENLLRAWDFSLPAAEADVLWVGYARRHINAYVPRFRSTDLAEAEAGKYDKLSESDRENERLGGAKTLNHLALDDRRMVDDGRWIGVEALMTLKGDVDNLGLIFQAGLPQPTFAKMAALSRQLNAFFAVYLPTLCAREFPNAYTVFAGGDDFFLIGPWRSTIKLAQRMKDEFARFVAGNPDIHFSAGLSMTKPGMPIRQLASLADDALDKAKTLRREGSPVADKNAVTCFGCSVDWSQFDQLMEREAGLGRLASQHALSTGYVYGLLLLTEMAGSIRQRPKNAMWYSRFAYRTRRLVETRFRETEDKTEREKQRRRFQAELATEISSLGIEAHGAAYKIALFTHLYQQRD